MASPFAILLSRSAPAAASAEASLSKVARTSVLLPMKVSLQVDGSGHQRTVRRKQFAAVRSSPGWDEQPVSPVSAARRASARAPARTPLDTPTIDRAFRAAAPRVDSA